MDLGLLTSKAKCHFSEKLSTLKTKTSWKKSRENMPKLSKTTRKLIAPRNLKCIKALIMKS